ncbi:SDR family oxidoreductase [Ramlibacter albus]|uniref:SDR family oxidoreductase n=1 Tax=Ramlibacter albus TaxID=2079448 RepID=A0A923S2S8_9BURK|nr:SDR family oxidoreductase [Ramlibacter albus]MBC5765666.1 SDR family oxidoreductase [Ramlibacter albus]
MNIVDSLRPQPGLRVLVTAGANGIGAVIARAFHEAGAHVHVCDIDRAALDRLATEAPGISSSAADASMARDVDLVFDDVRGTLGGLDVLVNNAGIAGPTAAVQDTDPELWERTVAVNLGSQFLFARRAAPLLKESRANPCIVAMSSVAGRLGCAHRTPYAATKWAVVGLMKSLAIELGPHGVRINAILPGAVDGKRTDGATREACSRRTSLRRMVTAEDVAAMALFLCSPAARNVTGQAVSVDANTEYL